MKKGTVILLILIMAFSIFAGCSNEPKVEDENTAKPEESTANDVANTEEAADEMAWLNEEGIPVVNEDVTYKLLAPRTASQGEWEDMWIFQEMKDRLGVTIDITTVDEQAWEEKKNLAFASDDLPDFFISGLTSDDIVNYGTQGVLMNLGEFLNTYDNAITNNFLSKYPDILKEIKSTDGNIYYMPSIVVIERERDKRRSYLNTQWLENLGLSVPTTVDELHTVLLAFKNEDANMNGDATDEIPLSGMFENEYFAMDIPILTAFGFVDTRIDLVDDTVVYVPIQDEYKEYLKYMNQLYQDDLIDKEYFTQSQDQFTAKGLEGKYGMYCYWANFVMQPDVEDYLEYEMIPPLTSDVNDVQMWPAGAVATLSNTFAIVSTCEKPEGIFRAIDYFYTEEGRVMARAGVEDGTWEGEGGFKWVTNDEGVKCFEFVMPDDIQSSNVFREKYILPMSMPYGDDGTMHIYFTGLDPRQNVLSSGIIDNHAPYFKEVYPNVSFTVEESEEINLLDTDIDTYVKQMEAKFITGEISFDEWDTFADNVKKMDVDTMVKLYQDAYDRWMAD